MLLPWKSIWWNEVLKKVHFFFLFRRVLGKILTMDNLFKGI
jgi:hypothetical protein